MLEKKISLFTNNKGNEFLTQLEATLELSDKLDSVVEAVKSIPETVIPETLIPDYPSEMVISNLPDVQKVEITNLPTEKDDKEQLALLKEISQELKKKEEYAYDIEIDSTLKEQLRGERGADGVNGKDGTEITNGEVRDKLEALEGNDRLDVSAVKGTEELIEDIVNDKISKIPKPKVYVGGGSSSSSGGIQSVVAGTNVTVDNTDPANPVVSSTGGVAEDSFGIVVDGGGSAVTTGSKGTKYIPWNCTVTGWDIRSDVSGSCVFDIKRSGVSLAGTEKPTLSSSSSNSDLALSTWTTSLSAGDVIEFVVDSASTLTRATVTILVNKV